MIRRVAVAAEVLHTAHQLYGEERSPRGAGSEYDFVGGPLAAATFAFRGFDDLSYDVVPQVRSYTVVDPVFGVVTFTAVLVADGGKDAHVEIVSFLDDPDYWAIIDNDPE